MKHILVMTRALFVAIAVFVSMPSSSFAIIGDDENSAYVYYDEEQNHFRATTVASATYANSFAPGIDQSTKSDISGEIYYTSVTSLGNHAFQFNMDVGSQKFVSRGITPKPDGFLRLVSLQNPDNVLVFRFAADVSDIDTSVELCQMIIAFAEFTKTQPFYDKGKQRVPPGDELCFRIFNETPNNTNGL